MISLRKAKLLLHLKKHLSNTMQALLLVKDDDRIRLSKIDQPQPGPGQALVKLKAASLNRRDEWCRQGKYPGLQFDTVLGSDGAGVVEEVADPSDQSWVGKEVVINPNNSWGDDPAVQGPHYNILGMPQNGTFAEYIAINVDRLSLKPEHLDFASAAGCPLAGLTAFRAVFTQGKVQSGQNVLVTGIGGGVAQFCFQFAAKAGAQVYVSSSSDQKLDQAKSMGATGGFDYTQEDWIKQAVKLSGGFDLVVDSSGGDQFNQLLNLIKPGGRFVFFGATAGGPNRLDLFKIFWKQITIQGTSMGTDDEFEKMLAYISEHKIFPIVDSVRPLAEIVSAFDQMRDSKQSGKLVIEI